MYDIFSLIQPGILKNFKAFFQFFVVLTKQFNIQLNYLNYQPLCIFVILLQKSENFSLKPDLEYRKRHKMQGVFLEEIPKFI